MGCTGTGIIDNDLLIYTWTQPWNKMNDNNGTLGMIQGETDSQESTLEIFIDEYNL